MSLFKIHEGLNPMWVMPRSCIRGKSRMAIRINHGFGLLLDWSSFGAVNMVGSESEKRFGLG